MHPYLVLYLAGVLIAGSATAAYQYRVNGQDWFGGWIDYVLCGAMGLIWPMTLLGVLPWLAVKLTRKDK